jgi:hypothetical protein
VALKKEEEETVEEERGIVYSARQSDSCIDDNIHGSRYTYKFLLSTDMYGDFGWSLV